MTAVLLVMLVLIAVGVALALALPGAPRRIDGLLGEAWILGCSAAGFSLLLLSIVGIPWSAGLLIAILAAITLVAVFFSIRRRALLPVLPKPGWANLIDLFTLALVAGHARLATLAPPIEADFILIWGVKARKFLLAGGIDWEFLTAPHQTVLHPSYPILTPLVYDVYALLGGAWPDRWIGLITTAYGMAGLLILRAALAEEFGKVARATATAMFMPLVFSPYIGISEGPLVACTIASFLCFRRAIRNHDAGLCLRGAIFLGLAASHKNEGNALIIAAALGLVAARAFSLLPRLWPAIAITLPWAILHWSHELPGDVGSTSALQSFLSRISDPLSVLRVVFSYSMGSALFWTGCLAGIVLGVRRLLRAERFLAIAISAQILFFMAAYFIIPDDVTWQVQWSWDRILRQVMPLVALLALLSVGEAKGAAPVIRFEPEEA